MYVTESIITGAHTTRDVGRIHIGTGLHIVLRNAPEQTFPSLRFDALLALVQQTLNKIS